MKKVALLVGLAAAIGYNNAEAVDWNWKGDIRYRYESKLVDKESSDNDHSRDRHRMRVRFGVYPWITEELSAGLQLSTGAGDPVSRNETLGDEFITDDIMLNEAYIDYHPMFLNGDVNVILGKRDIAKTLIVTKDLVWDSDITLEGGTLQYGKDAGGKEKEGVNAIAGWYSVKEGSAEQDPYFIAGQLAYGGEISDLGYKAGVAYYDFAHFDELGEGDRDFNIVEIFASVGGSITEKLPWKVYGQYAFNTAEAADWSDIDDDKRDAYLIGLKIGNAKNPGQWAVSGEYVSIEEDAVTYLTDSDRNNGSSTDLEGFKLNATYHLVQNMTLGATYMNFSPIDDDSITNHLLQADVVVKF
ncbi:MAG: putative porin [Chlorobiaceae bacterium]|jgi:hypothetical protein|nr:putative porin [Chlorobiaceae bacterium]